jgi:TolB-like protein/class 3 adenylate cyclase
LSGERVTRRLAAILAADVVGYSRLMGRDEAGTLSQLKAHRIARLEPTLARHDGRLVKLTGDGALVEFPSAVEALGAAIEFQQLMAEANRDKPENNAIVFRIGLHLGDLIVDGDDLYGDGVNIAARLEAEAPAGGIVLSGNVHDAVVGRLKVAFEDLGDLALKNIERPVRAYRVRAEGMAASSATVASSPSGSAPLALPDKPSIAVLPFQNMSSDVEQEYFADGVVEDIITALSRFKSLFVIARNSSFTYKGKIVDIKQVGRELGVRYVLEGSVRKAGGKVRITGQLIDCMTGAHLWADRIDGSLDDVFELQDQVTASVVGAIAPKLDQAEVQRAKRKPVENLDAYDAFLRGLAYSYEWTKEGWNEALRLFQLAIELDPSFSTPYGIAARAYAVRKAQGWSIDRSLEQAEIRNLASRVSSIGRDDALALSWAGFALAYVCLDYDTGGAMVDQALAINPNLAAGWTNRGTLSIMRGRYQKAREEIAHALRLNPVDPEAFRPETLMAWSHFLDGRYDDALSWATRALAHQPVWRAALITSAASYALTGNDGEAAKVVGEIRRSDPTYCLSSFMSDSNLSPEDNEKFVEGLRRAGLPE